MCRLGQLLNLRRLQQGVAPLPSVIIPSARLWSLEYLHCTASRAETRLGCPHDTFAYPLTFKMSNDDRDSSLALLQPRHHHNSGWRLY
jgi:hypothetical protein